MQRASKANQQDGSARRISLTSVLERPAGWTSSLYLNPFPVRIFEDWPFSLYIVASPESDERLVFKDVSNIFWEHPFSLWVLILLVLSDEDSYYQIISDHTSGAKISPIIADYKMKDLMITIYLTIYLPVWVPIWWYNTYLWLQWLLHS